MVTVLEAPSLDAGVHLAKYQPRNPLRERADVPETSLPSLNKTAKLLHAPCA